MAVKFYDDALLKKLSKWTLGTNIQIFGVNETKRLFEVLSDNTDDRNIKLPIIALSRPKGYTLNNKNKRPASYFGMLAGYTKDKGARLNILPITIDYQIDVYTKYLDEADEYVRNLIFNIINYPKLSVDVPYEDLDIVHEANIRVTSDVDDNSDIPERLIPGQFTRLTIGLNIDDAFLFDVRIKDTLSIKEITVIPGTDPAELITIDY